MSLKGRLYALLGEHRPGAGFERRAHPRQRDAVAQQVAQLTQLARRDVGLRQQPRAQQVGQRARVDSVVLDPRRGDRLGAQRV
jgi:hypothetical protein